LSPAPRRPPATDEVPRSAELRSVIVARIAGARPNSTPTSSETAAVNASMRQSGCTSSEIVVEALDARRESASLPHTTRRNPVAPPAAA